jgi:AbrB family looped-hinge helix DNA binding protein
MLYDQVTVGEGGRFVIPAAFREAMGIKPKDELTIRFDDGELRMVSRKQAQEKALKEIRDLMRPYKDKPSMVDDFLARRREMWGE